MQALYFPQWSVGLAGVEIIVGQYLVTSGIHLAGGGIRVDDVCHIDLPSINDVTNMLDPILILFNFSYYHQDVVLASGVIS